MPSIRNATIASICRQLKQKVAANLDPNCKISKTVSGYSPQQLQAVAGMIFDALDADDQVLFDAHMSQAVGRFVGMWWGPGFPALEYHRKKPRHRRAEVRNRIRERARDDFVKSNKDDPKSFPAYFTQLESEVPVADEPTDVQRNSGPTQDK